MEPSAAYHDSPLVPAPPYPSELVTPLIQLPVLQLVCDTANESNTFAVLQSTPSSVVSDTNIATVIQSGQNASLNRIPNSAVVLMPLTGSLVGDTVTQQMQLVTLTSDSKPSVLVSHRPSGEVP